MKTLLRPAVVGVLLHLLSQPPASAVPERVVIAEASYTMTDADTLSGAEEKVLQRAQRRAVEEAGVYLEATFQDWEKEAAGHSMQTSTLEIRTIAAAVTETEILESRKSFENDRPVFFVRIRATVDVAGLGEAVRRLQSEARLTQHYRQLQQENHQLRAQLKELQQQPVGVRMLTIEPTMEPEGARRARALVSQAMQTQNLREKITLSTEALRMDGHAVDPLLVRGQTYLRLVSLAFAQKQKPAEYADLLEKAREDFDLAIQLDGRNAWGWTGKGDVHTWLKEFDEAAASYEHALALDPFFDTARQRLIAAYTTQARRQAQSRHPQQALATLQKLLDAQTPDSWIPYQKEAYLLRSDLYIKLNRPEQALEDLSTVIRVDPTNTGALMARARIYESRLQGRLAKDDFERACVLGSITACEQLP